MHGYPADQIQTGVSFEKVYKVDRVYKVYKRDDTETATTLL